MSRREDAAGGARAVIEDILATQNSGRTIESLQALVEQFLSKEHGLQKVLADLDAQAEDVTQQIVDEKAARNARTGKGSLAASASVAKTAQRELKLKESMLNRLRMVEDRHNRDLLVMREQINTLRVDAMDRNKHFDTLAAKLQHIKTDLVEALERSNVILAERNELSDQLKTVKADDAEHKKSFETRLADLKTQIDAMQAAMVKAAKAGKLAGQDSGDDKGGKGGEDDGPGSGNLTEEQEEAARANIMKLDVFIREYEAVVADLHAQTAQLQEVFKHMIAQAGLERLDQLVEKFAEEEAFKYEIFG
jgi:hypothetical protein